MALSLADKIVRLHRALASREIPHAFGGALALAWCTERARGTIDIDLNVFVDVESAEETFSALPASVAWTREDIATIVREGQVRLWWDHTPIDLFLNTLKLHEQMARRCRWEHFAGESVPFLSCRDVAILKVFFNRTKDWADLEEMQRAGTLDIPSVTSQIIEYLGTDDERIPKLMNLSEQA
jgi:hypothetical protein